MSYVVKEAAATVLLENGGRTLLYKGEPVPNSADKADIARLVKEGYLAEVQTSASGSDAKEMQAGADPGDFSVAQVQAFLATADDEEKARVIEAEKAGKNRSTLTGATS